MYRPRRSNWLTPPNTDGTNIRRLSTWDPNGPNNGNVAWIPVAWSPGGTKILANRGSAPFVTDGQALDWYVKP